MLKGICCLLFNFCIKSEVLAIWKSLHKNKTIYVINEEELFSFWSARPSEITTSSRMLKQEAVLTLRLRVAHDGLCLIPAGGGKCRCSSLGSRPAGQLSLWAHPWEPLLPVPAPPPLLLPPRVSQMFLPEKAAAAPSLPLSISLVVRLYPAVMELLIVPPFPSPSFHKDWAVVIRGKGIILCFFPTSTHLAV